MIVSPRVAFDDVDPWVVADVSREAAADDMKDASDGASTILQYIPLQPHC